MAINYGLSKHLAFERIGSALKNELANELSNSVDGTFFVDLYLPAPTQYHLSSDDPFDIVMNEEVCCFLYKTGPDNTLAYGSGGATKRHRRIQWNMKIDLWFRFAPLPSRHFLGTEMTQTDLLRRRGDFYVSAIVECLHKYGCHDDAIHYLEVGDNDVVTYNLDQEPFMLAVAEVEVLISQNTTIPQRQFGVNW